MGLDLLFGVGVMVLLAAALFVSTAALRRRRVRAWNSLATVASNNRTSLNNPSSFPSIWFRTKRPGPSLRPSKTILRGDLLVDPVEGQVLFKLKAGGTIVLSNVTDVQMGRRGTDYVNGWIEVHADVASDPTVVYLNDGGWAGWRPLLSDSNVRIATALAQLVPVRAT